MIAGYSTLEQVQSHCAGLRAERRANTGNKARVATIDRSLKVFSAELDRMRAEEAKRLSIEAQRLQAQADAAAGIV